MESITLFVFHASKNEVVTFFDVMLCTGHKEAIIKSLPEFAKDSTKPVKKRSGVSVSPDAVSHADRKITLFGKYTASISELEIKTVLLFSTESNRGRKSPRSAFGMSP